MTGTPALLPSRTRDEIDLSGTWSLALDPHGVGEAERWFDPTPANGPEPRPITVPGSWEEQGFGEPAPEFIGGWTKRRSYEGPAWYRRELAIPADWTGRRVHLQLDRVSWRSDVYVDGERVSRQDSLSAPHLYDLTEYVRPGSRHALVVRVDNKVEGVLNFEGHIHSRHTATTWGGIIGAARLVSTPARWIADADVHPDAATGTVHLRVRLAGHAAPLDPETVRIAVHTGDSPVTSASVDVEGDIAEATLELGDDARRWSTNDPFLYDLTIALQSPDADAADEVHDRFGLRTFAVEGRSLTLNGSPLFLRGYVDCCIFPLTGYPPEDKSVYAAQFAKAREWGFDHVRLHSWTPGKAFFDAADEAGMLVQTELPNWSNDNSEEYLAGAGDFLRSELERILGHLQRHPSFVICSMGNESLQAPPNGAGFRYSPFLNDLVRRGRELDPTRVYADQTGFGFVPEEDERETDLFVLHTFRGTNPDSTTDWQDKIAGGKTPVIAHEHSQIDMYARFDEIEKFTGIMEPSWLEQAKIGLASKGILDDAERNVAASGALQALCLKELFERLRRTPGLSGVQMLNFTDFPGQGSALNGPLDVFWDEKGHIDAEEFRRFNAATVLLCKSKRRTYASGSYLEAEIALSHFGTAALDGTVHWTLELDDGTVLAEGREPAHARPGTIASVATITHRLPGKGSHRVRLTATLDDPNGRPGENVHNDWDFWVFQDTRWQGADTSIRVRPSIAWLADYYDPIRPDTYDFMAGSRESDPTRQVLISDRLHVRYVDPVVNGATMIWLAENDDLLDGITTAFEPVFWSFLWFPEQPNQTMGITVEEHPLLAGFPHADRSDWQWFHLLDGATAIGLDALPGVRPIVSGIDNWNRGKRLGYLFEARVGKGRILVTTLKLLANYHERPEAVNLFDAMLRYVHTDRFAPEAELTLAQLWSIPRYPVAWSHQ